MEKKIEYILREADNNLILGQRLGQWCGHGPALELDIALTNIALDLIGQARNLYAYAASCEGQGKTEDSYAYFRDVMDFRNVLLVEQPNGHWGTTIVRQFFYDAFHYHFLEKLRSSKDEQLVAIAEKSLKEVAYHLRFSSGWMVRLGDGTEESHDKIQGAVNDLWMYTGELFEMTELDKELIQEGIAVDLSTVKPLWEKEIRETFTEAGLTIPEQTWMNGGGKRGIHSEHLGYILAEMQFLPRAYPNAKW